MIEVKMTAAQIVEMVAALSKQDELVTRWMEPLREAVAPKMITSADELNKLPVESAILIGSKGAQRVRVKNVDGRWVGTGKDKGFSSVDSENILYWNRTSVQLLHVGDGGEW